MLEIIAELNDILVRFDSLVAPTKSSGIAIKDGFLLSTYATWQEALNALLNLECLSDEQTKYFLEKISTSEYLEKRKKERREEAEARNAKQTDEINS